MSVRATLAAPWLPSKMEDMKCLVLSLLAKNAAAQIIHQYSLTATVISRVISFIIAFIL